MFPPVLVLLFLVTGLSFAAEKPAAERLFAAIRKGEASAVSKLLRQGASPDAMDQDGTPALMLAALYGGADCVKALLDGGANPNATNKTGATALMWAVPNPEKVKLLVARGADINARSRDLERTPLLIAAGYPRSAEVVRFLIGKGADVRAVDKDGMGVLGRASLSSDVEMLRLLLEGGRAFSEAGFGPSDDLVYARHYPPSIEYLLSKHVKIGANALALAPNRDEPKLFERLIAGGADVNARLAGVQRTPLLTAASAEQSGPDTVRLLLEKGADPNVEDYEGERPLDWATYRGDPARVELLQQYGARHGKGPRQKSYPAPEGMESARESVARSVALILPTAPTAFKNRGCITCHNQSMVAVLSAAARQKGIPVNESLEEQNLKQIRGVYRPAAGEAMQGDQPAGNSLTIGYIMMALDAEREPLNQTTAAFTHLLCALQMEDGSWLGNGISRPPMEDSTVSHTVMAVRALTLYPIPGRRGEVEEALWRARRWLLANHAQNTEERNMRLMGLTWTEAARQEIDAAVAEVLAQQDAEGGWRQLPQWSPDAYATGMALCALRESGMNPGDSPYRKGVAFLLQNQYRDGSWFVKTRSSPVQPYFESGYPFGSNQWISAQGAAWATLAIAATLPDAKPTPSAERARP
jgi:ankyrin repeat protein